MKNSKPRWSGRSERDLFRIKIARSAIHRTGFLILRTVDLKIKDVAFGGKGVGRDNGKAVFIPFTINGERVSAKIVRGKKQFAEAKLVDLIEVSPHRVQPPCPYFGRCGGCSYQHTDYEHQLTLKFRQVRDLLERMGRLGFAGWYRKPGYDGWGATEDPHIHTVWAGCPDAIKLERAMEGYSRACPVELQGDDS